VLHIFQVYVEINKEQDLAALNQMPPKSNVTSVIAWLIPLLIISIIGYTFYANPSAGLQQTLSWILWNGSFSALGTAIALGHPLAVVTAFVVAPLSSLSPLMAAGWFAGIVQAYFRRPRVEDFENLSEAVYTVKGFWGNKVTRILLVVTLANIGSTLGTVIGGADVIRLFIENL
jgi:pheromone shutdown protein TraB